MRDIAEQAHIARRHPDFSRHNGGRARRHRVDKIANMRSAGKERLLTLW